MPATCCSCATLGGLHLTEPSQPSRRLAVCARQGQQAVPRGALRDPVLLRRVGARRGLPGRHAGAAGGCCGWAESREEALAAAGVWWRSPALSRPRSGPARAARRRQPASQHAHASHPADPHRSPAPLTTPQVGLPSSREQYIHRLGRTARAGRTGRGLLLLMPEEQHFLRQLKGARQGLGPCVRGASSRIGPL